MRRLDRSSRMGEDGVAGVFQGGGSRRPVSECWEGEDDRIYVLESVRHRFQIYQKDQEYEEAALNL